MQPIFYNYNIDKYNFAELIRSEVFPLTPNLDVVHEYYSQHVPNNVVEFETENHTFFHKSFYEWLNSEAGNKIKVVYEDFIRNEIAPMYDGEEWMFQKFPTCRFHLPHNRAISKPHWDSDEDHKHPVGEKNYIIALTKCYPDNITWTETVPFRDEEYVPLTMEANQFVRFDGNQCRHFNKVSEIDKTRVSFDFRVLLMKDYLNQTTTESVTKKNKFGPTGYYKMFEK